VKVYKIFDMTTGLYKNEGTKPCWSKEGKMWKTIGAVKNHLTQCCGENFKYTWEVHEFVLSLNDRSPITLFTRPNKKK
jgi:hypothetical protein